MRSSLVLAPLVVASALGSCLVRAAPEPTRLYVQSTSINLRDAPSPAGVVVGTARIDAPCDVLELTAEWARVTCDYGDGDTAGWAKRTLLAPTRPSLEENRAKARDARLQAGERETAALRAVLLSHGADDDRTLARERFFAAELAALRRARAEKKTRPRKTRAVRCATTSDAAPCLARAFGQGRDGIHVEAAKDGSADFVALRLSPGGRGRTILGRFTSTANKLNLTVEAQSAYDVDAGVYIAFEGKSRPAKSRAAFQASAAAKSRAERMPLEHVDDYLQRCDYVPMRDTLIDFDNTSPVEACRSLDFDQSCAPDTFGCDAESDHCTEACGDPCSSCEASCASTCTACADACGEDPERSCRRACAVDRARCQNLCLASRAQCLTDCGDALSRCYAEGEATRARLCPKDTCDAYGLCSQEPGCAKKHPMPEPCYEWCFQE